MLGRIETRTRDRIYCQTIRTVREISPRRSSKNCDLQFANTDRQTYNVDRVSAANYVIDSVILLFSYFTIFFPECKSTFVVGRMKCCLVVHT